MVAFQPRVAERLHVMWLALEKKVDRPIPRPPRITLLVDIANVDRSLGDTHAWGFLHASAPKPEIDHVEQPARVETNGHAAWIEAVADVVLRDSSSLGAIL